jgi:starch synthase
VRGTVALSADPIVSAEWGFRSNMAEADVLSGGSRAHAPPASVPARPEADEPPQRILYVTSEIADFIKAGGLGEVSAALPRTLKQQYDVRILVPGYRKVLESHAHLPVVGRLPAAHGLPACEIGRFETIDGLIIYVLLCADLYDRDGTPYGDEAGQDWDDNDIRFARLGLAAAEIACGIRELGWKPDLLHLNDWPSALASGYLSWREKPLPSVLTIHNLAYQGLFEAERLPRLGIPENAFQIEGVEFYGKLSFLKAGIVYSSHVTTVSSTYAREITTPEYGCGLDGLLRLRAGEGRLTGILNGIDESWDPRTDPYLASPFEPQNLKGKVANRDEVRREFGLAVSRGPLFAVVSRLVHQKGVDLAIEATETIVREGGQIVVTGKGEGRLETDLENLAKRYPDRVGVKLGYEEGTARRMYAGSDFLLMPSRFEPCGLSQMYAQKFGSLPIAHRTGGLADTIEDGVTGFLFREPSLGDLLGAVYRAVDAFRSRKKLNAMRRAAMARTFAWQRSAMSYKKVYDRTLIGARG